MPHEKNQLEVLGKTLERNIPEILFAYLFGSYAIGSQHQGSDVDIAVFLAKNTKSVEVIAQIISSVEETIPDTQCDLTILNDAGVIVAMEALKGRLFFIRAEAEDIHSEFYAHTCMNYEDHILWIKKQLNYRGYEVQWSY